MLPDPSSSMMIGLVTCYQTYNIISIGFETCHRTYIMIKLDWEKAGSEQLDPWAQLSEV